MSLVAGGPEAAQQPGLRPALQWREQGDGTSAFQILTETAACEQQGHRRWSKNGRKSGSLR